MTDKNFSLAEFFIYEIGTRQTITSIITLTSMFSATFLVLYKIFPNLITQINTINFLLVVFASGTTQLFITIMIATPIISEHYGPMEKTNSNDTVNNNALNLELSFYLCTIFVFLINCLNLVCDCIYRFSLRTNVIVYAVFYIALFLLLTVILVGKKKKSNEN